jgi:hypothetical protein
MTVRELIEELKLLPNDYTVVDDAGNAIDNIHQDDAYCEITLESEAV